MNNSKILIVDDDPGNIEIITDILENNNWLLLVASNGSVACNIALKELPDLILMDWEMPCINGLDATKILKNNKITSDIPIIMISGVNTSSEFLSNAFNAGVIDFIKKPFNKLELIARVKSMLLLSKYHKEAIYSKNKELKSSALKLVKSNEFRNKILESLEILKQVTIENPAVIKEKISALICEINTYSKSNSWQNFEAYFTEIHPVFYTRLLNRHPDLTPAELKLCALLSLNLGTKDIASVFGQAYDSVRVSRTRLRKKLSIESEGNLVGYLMQFS